MAIAYSEDLRKRAVSLIESGKKIEKVAKLLNIARSTLFRWVRQKKTEGSLTPKKDWRKGYGNKIPDLEKFEQFVKENQGLTATAMAEKWGSISVRVFCKWLKRIGFTRKKKPTIISSGMKKNVSYIWKQ
ncbi:helix-turn-helix domain-containing protein [Candidatus Dependentiae bacterium]|nr:helix-turn-helix domain-containing protein [Candidatus Dependentiae bacterium]